MAVARAFNLAVLCLIFVGGVVFVLSSGDLPIPILVDRSVWIGEAALACIVAEVFFRWRAAKASTAAGRFDAERRKPKGFPVVMKEDR